MADQDATVYAEDLIRTVARAFYDDSAICLIDVLLHDKFLRDDDMSKRLSLSAKQLRQTLTFLKTEHLVKSEMIDDLEEGGSQNTTFWYIDYNMAVHSIRLRIYLMQKKLEEAELRARSCSMYLCPGYALGECRGRYTEAEAQIMTDEETGLFLCRECAMFHENNPNPPPKERYILQLLDNSEDLRVAVENSRRIRVQMSAKMVGTKPIRAGIYDLIQKVRKVGGGTPLTSNLPSENRDIEIGTTRLDKTGRTYNIKAKKLTAKDGAAIKLNTHSTDELTFLKNAMGQQLTFKLEKGGGARANLLATRGKRGPDLLDAAAIRVGVELDLVSELARQYKRKKEEEEKNADEAKKEKELAHLRNNIGRDDLEQQDGSSERLRKEQETASESEDDVIGIAVDSDDEFADMTDDERRVRFSAYYKKEMARQKARMQPHNFVPENGDEIMDDGENIAWDDG